MKENDEIPWDALNIEEPVTEKKNKGGFGKPSPPLKGFTAGQIIAVVILLCFLAISAFLYFRVKELRSEVSLLSERLGELVQANKNVSGDLMEMSRRIESLKMRAESMKVAPVKPAAQQKPAEVKQEQPKKKVRQPVKKNVPKAKEKKESRVYEQ